MSNAKTTKYLWSVAYYDGSYITQVATWAELLVIIGQPNSPVCPVSIVRIRVSNA